MAIVLQGEWTSSVHNGGVHEAGKTPSGPGVDTGAARAVGESGQFALLAARVGDPGADHPAECAGPDEPFDCRPIAMERGHGWQMASPLPRPRDQRVARRMAPRTPALDQRRADGQSDPQNLADETARRHALERPPDGRPEPTGEVDGASHLASPGSAAASPAVLQAVERSVFRREGARHRRSVSEPAGQGGGAGCG